MVKWRDHTTLHRYANSDNLVEDSMDLVRFFLVSYQCLVGVSGSISCKDFFIVCCFENHNKRALVVGYDLNNYFQMSVAMTSFCLALEEGLYPRNIYLLQLPLVKCPGQIILHCGLIRTFLSDLHKDVPQWTIAWIRRRYGWKVLLKSYYYHY